MGPKAWSAVAAAFLLAIASRPASGQEGEAPSLRLPLICDMAQVCSIQNYFDHRPGPERLDYACGRLSYDGHDGTDFRVPDEVVMRQGVPVVAAADGVVRGVRDSMPDVNVKTLGPDAVKGREAGNGVVIDHGAGWHTQYSHLKRGSVRVRPGQQVKAGDLLGEIGMSGMAEFPHVEFAVRRNGVALDPFVGDTPFGDCADARRPLWSEETLAALPYRATGPLIAGFATGAPKAEEAQQGRHHDKELPVSAPALVMWVEIFGAMEGDIERFSITGPGGARVLDIERPLKTSYVKWFSFSGRKRPGASWPEGPYRGVYSLTRDGKEVFSIARSVTLVTTQ